MRKKINDIQKDKSFSLFGKGSKKVKNDFRTILNYRRGDEEKQEDGLSEKDDTDLFGHEPDPFLMDLIGKDLTKNKH